ncbi:HEAT repeat domain-containing protein [Thermodesulfobacteriota bacterium]
MKVSRKVTFKSIAFTVIACTALLFTGCNATKTASVSKNDHLSKAPLSEMPITIKNNLNKLHSNSSSERVYGIMGLSKAGRNAIPAVPYLIEALNEQNSNIKPEIIKALGNIGDRRATKPIVAFLANRTSPHRAVAAKALGRIADPNALEPLVAILSDKSILDSNVIKNAVWAIGRIGSPRAIEPLIMSLEDNSKIAAEALSHIDPNWQKTATAAHALSHYIGAIQDKNLDEQRRTKLVNALSEMGTLAIDPLFSMLFKKSATTRENAAKALSKLDWHPSNQAERVIYLIASKNFEELTTVGAPAIGQLVSTMMDPDKDVRLSAALALDELGWTSSKEDETITYLIASNKWNDIVSIGAPAVAPLTTMLRDSDPFIRNQSASALVAIGSPAIKSLIFTLKDKRVFTRSIASSALDQSDADWKISEEAKKAVPILMLSLNNIDKDVRCSAAWALSVIKDHRAVDALISTLKDDDQAVRLYAAKALGAIADSRAVTPLITILKEESDPVVRGYAALALGGIKDKQAIKPLIHTLMDKDSWPQQSAARALKKIDPDWINDENAKEAIPALIACLTNSNMNIQKGAAKALGVLHDHSAVLPLINIMLQSDDDNVRSTAARALGKIGSQKAVAPLLEALSNKSVKVDATTYALAKIKDSRSVRPLIRELENERARSYVAKALEKITGEHFGENRLLWEKWLEKKCEQGQEFCLYIEAK